MKNYHEYTTQELNNQLLELKQSLFNLRFEHKVARLENANKLNTTKKDIARVMTVIRERELGLSEEPQKGAKKASKAKKED